MESNTNVPYIQLPAVVSCLSEYGEKKIIFLIMYHISLVINSGVLSLSNKPIL